MALERTKSLIAELATALGLPALAPDDTGGYHVTAGAGIDIYLYGGDDEEILIVAPLAPLPREPEYGLVLYLLRTNLFDSDVQPFQIATDNAGVLIFWGRVRIADLDGSRLAQLIDRVAARAGEIRTEIGGEEALIDAAQAMKS
jgi:Tir chaperone protein (CesT) family